MNKFPGYHDIPPGQFTIKIEKMTDVSFKPYNYFTCHAFDVEITP